MNYQEIQIEEAKTWCIEDETVRRDKVIREVIRYPLLRKQMGLSHLETHNMVVWDIGAGPLLGVSSVIPSREVLRIDPLKEEYARFFDVSTYDGTQAEHLKDRLATPDLIIATNCIDHFEDPRQFLEDCRDYMKPGAFFAHFHAINNAITHPHPAHVHNVNPQLIHEVFHKDFETVWHLDYQSDGLTYGWRKQPAFTDLIRKTKYD